MDTDAEVENTVKYAINGLSTRGLEKFSNSLRTI